MTPPGLAAAAAAAALAEEGGSEDHAATVALISYLRSEAAAADAKAKSLRQQAQQLAQTFGITQEAQRRYEIVPQDLPPLDDQGVPKYKGKKRGRKPKPRKRKAPSRRRQHTGYTFFMQEKYPIQKADHPNLANKEIIAIVARQWKELSPTEKTVWKEKAASTHVDQEGDADDEQTGRTSAKSHGEHQNDEDGDDEAEFNTTGKPAVALQNDEASSSGQEPEESIEEDHNVDEEYDSEAAPPARRRPRLKKYEDDEEEAAPPARRRRRNAV